MATTTSDRFYAQILDFVILDFEGEPLQILEQRRRCNLLCETLPE